MVQNLAPDCLELLRAITDALQEWSANVSRASRQQQQQQTPCEMLHTGTLLSEAASSLLHCMGKHSLSRAIDGWQLLDALRQPLHRVLFPLPSHFHRDLRICAAPLVACQYNIDLQASQVHRAKRARGSSFLANVSPVHCMGMQLVTIYLACCAGGCLHSNT